MSQLERQAENKRDASRAKAAKKSFGGRDLCFVNYNLSAEQKLQVRALAVDDVGHLASEIFLMVEDGHKFTCNYNEERAFFVCTLMGWETSCKNLGYALTGEGKDLMLALASLVFKMRLLGGSQLWSDFVAEDEDMR